ncbi:MAG: response regulator [Lachnospiraceae bacterium]|nr:response regulator [Lachnospiraceae bacterium]
MEELETGKTKGTGKRSGGRKNSMLLPLLLVFLFVAVMVIYASRMMYRAAVSNAAAVMEDRMLGVSSMIENHIGTAENILHVTADSVYHMLISGSTPARIHEFLVEETDNVSHHFNPNFNGLYGYIMTKYLDGLNWEPPEDFDPRSRDWYTCARQADGEVVIVPPYVDAQTGEIIISVCRMLPDRQNVLSLDVFLNDIQEMVRELNIGGKGYGFVVDDSGLFIAHREEGLRGTNMTDTPEGAAFLQTIREKGPSTYTCACDGEKSTVYVTRVLDLWYVVMVVSNRELYADVRGQLSMNVFISTLIFLVIAVFSYNIYRSERRYTRKMQEMRLEEQKASYERRMLELEKDAANASNKAKSDFLARMSHEIRTPMNAIIGMDEMILREPVSQRVRKYALDIRSAGRTLLSIINDILDLSKIESGKMELVPVEYGFASVINDVVNMTRERARDKGLEFRLQVSPEIPSVLCGDEIRVRQVMLNLIGNAIKYTQKGSVSVDVSFDAGSGMLQIIVADTGIGIREEDRAKLFGAFQRLEEDRNRKIEGTGLGLNITLQLLKMMEGSIDVASVYGEGTTFTARMKQRVIDPAPIGDFAVQLADLQDQQENCEATFTAPKARLLVVDDNEMNLEVISALLEETKIRVTTAESGRECIAILQEERFDLVLLDQMMPGMSGVETLEILRKQHLADETPVVALTADAIVGARENYLREGFADYLSKPVMYRALEDLLRRLLNPALVEEAPGGKGTSVSKEASGSAGEGETPVVIGISPSSEKLRELKALLGSGYKGVFVKDMESAARYVEKNRK